MILPKLYVDYHKVKSIDKILPLSKFTFQVSGFLKVSFAQSGMQLKLLAIASVQEDLYYPHPLVQDILWATLHKFVEPVLMHQPGSKLRQKALDTAIQHIHYEDENTRYVCIGPVNKVFDILAYSLLLADAKVDLGILWLMPRHRNDEGRKVRAIKCACQLYIRFVKTLFLFM